MNILLHALDFNRSELKHAKNLIKNPDQAWAALLTHFKKRTTVKHPIDRSRHKKLKGRYADPNTLKHARNALKHIFLAQPSYPPHFCGKDIDWSTHPVPDNEWIWQLHRMYFWNSMARAYWHTRDEAFAKEWCLQLMDWAAKNPRDKQHHYAWRSIEAGIRGYSWTALFQHFIDSDHFNEKVLQSFLGALHEHATLLAGVYSKGSNWALMEAEGLAFIALTFPEFKDAEKWLKTAVGRFHKEIKKQVRTDGHQVEQCINYHLGCIQWFTRTAELAQLNGRKKSFPDSYWKTIEKMYGVLLKLGFPDGTSAQFGDTSHSMAWRTRLKMGARLFKRPDFLYAASASTSRRSQGKRPRETAFALKASGFYSMRSSWSPQAIGMVLKCGPGGYWHCQPDNGTFEIMAGGRRLMPDSGTYIYHGDPEGREWFRQTRVHQTLTLDGQNSAYAPKLLLWKPGKDLDVLVVENGSYAGLRHRRAVLFLKKKFFLLVDDAIGKAAGALRLHFQFAPGKATYETKRLSARTGFKDGWNIAVRCVGQEGLLLEKEKGLVSFDYGQRQPRPAFCFRMEKKASNSVRRFVSGVLPFKGAVPKFEMDVLKGSLGGRGAMTIAVDIGSDSMVLELDLSKKKVCLV